MNSGTASCDRTAQSLILITNSAFLSLLITLPPSTHLFIYIFIYLSLWLCHSVYA